MADTMDLAMARRTKRLLTDDEKRSICLQTTAPGVSVAQVARRYALNANVIFKWMRDPRFAPDPDDSDGRSLLSAAQMLRPSALSMIRAERRLSEVVAFGRGCCP